MGHALRHFEDQPASRDRHDAGRAGDAGRWFSARTTRGAERYRDIGWRHVGSHLIVALALILISRMLATEAVGPLLLMVGAVWTLALARIAVIKGLDHLTR